jgi:hemoglobin
MGRNDGSADDDVSEHGGRPADARPDLDTRAHIHDVVVDFYREVVFDELLEPIFGEVAEVDWERHIPLLIDYWCRVLLHEPGYDGSILDAHQHLHQLEPLRRELFDRWYALWTQSIDSRFEGPRSDAAKAHAARIGGTLARRVAGFEWQPEPVADRPLERGRR